MITVEQARARGYTEAVQASSTYYDLDLLVMPGQDLDDEFQAYCSDSSEWLLVKGWLWSFWPR